MNNNSPPRNLPALIILKRSRGCLRDNNRGENISNVGQVTLANSVVVVVRLFVCSARSDATLPCISKWHKRNPETKESRIHL